MPARNVKMPSRFELRPKVGDPHLAQLILVMVEPLSDVCWNSRVSPVTVMSVADTNRLVEWIAPVALRHASQWHDMALMISVSPL